jgi:hypothetical protein
MVDHGIRVTPDHFEKVGPVRAVADQSESKKDGEGDDLDEWING